MKTTKKILTAMLATAFLFGLGQNIFASSMEMSEPVEDREGDYYLPLPPNYVYGFIQGYMTAANSYYLPYFQKKSTVAGKSSAMFYTNVSEASIYLDGKYKGTGPLHLNDLQNGKHLIKITKTHYETKEFYIYIQSETDNYYYVELERISGAVTFNVSPANAVIKVNGDTYKSSFGRSRIELDEGRYKFSVTAFGYESWTSDITVYRRTNRNVTLILDPVPFELKTLKTDKSKFNPENNGRFGNLNIQIGVTAPESGVVTVKDMFDTVIWTHPVDFTTWDTTITWNGKDSSGLTVNDGIYKIEVTAAGQTASTSVTVDSSISYSLMLPTPSGAGTLSIASAEIYPEPTVALNFNAGWNTNNEVPYNFSLLLSTSKHLELSGAFHGNFLQERFGGYGAIKAGTSFNTASGNLYLAAAFRIGSNANPYLYNNFVYETGSGIGLSAMAGLKNGHIYTGFESSLIFHPVELSEDGMNFMWKKGILVQYTGNTTGLGVYGIFNSAFGEYNAEGGYSVSMPGWFSSVEAGAAATLFLGHSGAALSVNGNTVIYPDGFHTESVTAGISFTF